MFDRRIVANSILHVLNNNTKNEQYMKSDYLHELVKKYLTHENISSDDIKRGIKFLDNEVAVHVFFEHGYAPYGFVKARIEPLGRQMIKDNPNVFIDTDSESKKPTTHTNQQIINKIRVNDVQFKIIEIISLHNFMTY